ncbi:hypothetical protein, conserved [Plasmodium gonderi]|uniref:Uncharacterized protein n=1 Tax=Plasmodium gonderi TaxID=77519 RepID=A0A1Y1JJY4_PLAGO|nr:hypothetical protein, conserved [Plasmodium gonderi]GAW80364.1 hypothetical protein, conserved [Plasmodium gonderi]
MNIFLFKKFTLVIFFTLTYNSFYAKKLTRVNNHTNYISASNSNNESQLASHNRKYFFLLNNGEFVGSRKSRWKGGSHMGTLGSSDVSTHNTSLNFPKNTTDMFKINDPTSLIGGHVTICNGTFKQCKGVILDLKQTEKFEYELLVVINRDESMKYPKNILNKFGKSYWFNINDVQIEKVKDLFFHKYENFYDKKERALDEDFKDVREIKERFGELDVALRGVEAEMKSEFSSELGSKVETELSTEFGSKMEAKLDCALDSKVETEMDSALDSKMEAKLDCALDSKVETEMDSELGSKVETEMDSELGSKVETEMWGEETRGMASHDPRELIGMQENYFRGRKGRRRSIFCHEVVKKIEKNYFYEDLLNLYKEKRHLSNIVVCFYILKQLVRIYNFESDNENWRNLFLKNVIRSNIFELILTDVKEFLEKKEIYRVVDKTWLLWILVKLNIHKEERYKPIFEEILNCLVKYFNYDILKKLNTKTMCAILWSLSKCSYVNPKVYKKIIYFLEKYISVLSCQDMSNIYYSLALINYKSDENFFNLIDQEINKNINKFSLQSLINILWGMTKLKRNNSIFSVVKDKLLFHSSNMDIRNMSLFLWCLNKNQYYHVNVNFKGKSFQNLNIKQAMQLLMFFNYNKEKYVEYFKYVLNFLFENISKLTNQEISFLTYSLSKLNLLKKKCFLKIRKYILARDYRTFNLIDLNMILHSMNTSNIYDKILMNYLFHAIRDILTSTITNNTLTKTSVLHNPNENDNSTEMTKMTEIKSSLSSEGGTIDCTNFNYIIKNLSEMKIFDQSIILKYALFFSLNIIHISVDQISDYLFYTISLSPPGGQNEKMEKLENNKTKMNVHSKNQVSTISPSPFSRDQKIAKLVMTNNELKLKNANFEKIYQHYLSKIIQFLKGKLSHFDAHAFLTYLEEQNNGKKQNGEDDEKSKSKIDTFVFNYQTEKKHEHVKKLNELILEKTTNNNSSTTILESLISDKEFSSFVNQQKSDEEEEKKKKKKKTFLYISLNSLFHLFYSLASLNEFDKNQIDFYFDNLYTVVEKKKSEITAYQWLLIKDIVNMVQLKKKTHWEILLDNVNTYVSNTEHESSARFETIKIEI